MPEISVFTVLVLTAFNLLTVSLALPLLMGRQVSRAGRLAQWSLLSQMAGWVCIIASGFWIGHWLDWALSTASMVFASLTPWLLFGALEQWLGPRPGKRLLLALVLLMPLGYTVLFPHYSPRVGWANFLLAAQLLVVARAALWPERPARKHWRWLLAGCHCVGAGFTFARGVMGAFFPELYPSFQTAHPVNVGAQVSANVILVLITVSVLVVGTVSVVCLTRQIEPLDRWVGAFVAGGGGGNLIDRVQTGAVVDFLDLHWRNIHWPAFNLADVFIVCSMLVWCIASMKAPPRVSGCESTREGTS